MKNKKLDKKFAIQEAKYVFPYHHLVDFEKFSNYKVAMEGIRYYGYMNRIIDMIRRSNFNSLLDVGCGDGKMIFEIMKFSKGKRVVGADLSEKAIRFARAFNYENGAEFYRGDLADIEEKFDIITLIETIEHIPDEQVERFISNIYDRLNGGGMLIVSVPTDNIPVAAKHYRHYNLDLLRKQFYKFGLEETHYLIKNNMNLINRLSRKFCSINIIRQVLLFLSKKFLFNANKKNAAHIICVFKQGSI